MSRDGEPEVALAFGAERWIEAFHRHCADHGGVRVRVVVLDPAVALEESFDVLVAGHRWPALDASFVAAVHRRGALVVGVHERAEPASASFLTSIGVDRALPSDLGAAALVDEVVRAVEHVTPGAPGLGTDRRDASLPDLSRARPPGHVIALGGPSGSGRTEVAVALARALAAGGGGSSLLIDADDVAPSVAARLGLALEPNLATAVDRLASRGDDPDTVFAGAAQPLGGCAVLPGVPSTAAWVRPHPGLVAEIIEVAAARHGWVVVDVSSAIEPGADDRAGRFDAARAVLARADTVVAVGAADPVRCGRLINWVADAAAVARDAPIHAAINRVPRSAHRARQLVDEVVHGAGVASCSTVRNDPRVEAAAWQGTFVGRGPFTRDIDAIVAEIVATAATREPAARA